MITRNMKISTMLDEYPQTLEVLVDASPHFKKLQNKFLRRTLAHRVTVEQAASVGGVELNALLTRLNDSIGETYEKPATEMELAHAEPGKEAGQFSRVILESVSAGKESILDVRPMIAAGSDPLKVILKTVRDLGDGYVLHLINSFEPIPLYSVLGERGFDHETRNVNGVWHVYFVKRVAGAVFEPTSEGLPVSSAGVETISGIQEDVIELDVRGLAPPEPMMRILEKLSEVGERTLLLVHHHREPMMLYEKLKERGYSAVTNKINENYYKVLIRRMGT